MRHFENPGIVRTSIFRYFQAYSETFINIQPCSGILRDIKAYSDIFRHYWGNIEPHSDIFRTLCNPYIYNGVIFGTLTHLEPEASSKACQTSKMIKHIHSPGIIRTVYWSIFNYILGYSGILMHIYPNSQATNKRGGGHPCTFLKIKKSTDFGKKGPDCVHLWVKFYIQNVVLRVSKKRNSKKFPCGTFFSCVFFLQNVYESALVPQNLPYPENYLSPTCL